jgi:hypothetical protein
LPVWDCWHQDSSEREKNPRGLGQKTPYVANSRFSLYIL